MAAGSKIVPAEAVHFLAGGSKGATSRRKFLAESVKDITVLASGAALLALINGCGGGGGGNPVAPGGGNTEVQLDLSLPQYSSLATPGGMVTLGPQAISGLPRNGIFINPGHRYDSRGAGPDLHPPGLSGRRFSIQRDCHLPLPRLPVYSNCRKYSQFPINLSWDREHWQAHGFRQSL